MSELDNILDALMKAKLDIINEKASEDERKN